MSAARRLAKTRLFYCSVCRVQFSVTAGTVFEHSRVPLDRWVTAVRLACSSDGVNAGEVAAATGVTYKAAVGMMRRLRDAAERAAIRARSFRSGHERRLSFAPLQPEEAMRAILMVSPETREEKLDRAWAELTAGSKGK
jgi:hypothetical protein